MISAISSQVEKVRKIYPYTSLTFLMSNGKTVYGYRDCSSNDEYYTLFFARTPTSMLISQEKFIDAPWVSLENGKLLSVNDDLSFEVLDMIPQIESKTV